jgi:hypothetical protein
MRLEESKTSVENFIMENPEQLDTDPEEKAVDILNKIS